MKHSTTIAEETSRHRSIQISAEKVILEEQMVRLGDCSRN